MPRDAFTGVGAVDVFDTTPIIIGVILDPETGEVIFDPTTFDPVTDEIGADVLQAIIDAIEYQRAAGLASPEAVPYALDGVAYVSNGVSQATTVYGGDGEDLFNVYHNKGTLRLEGEADNDEFIVRAFVTIQLPDSETVEEQADTEINGGGGEDTINYAINAPVSIDGGAGFDKVVVLGTPFNDSFVVSEEGIFGAGLNVKFVGIENAELDTLEGDDNIYIQGTSRDIVTTVIGGLGDDVVNVMGDVINPIVSNDLLGRSGVITHDMSSEDAGFNVGVNGVAVNIQSEGDSIVDISPTGEPLRVTEDGLIASYFISLVAPDATDLSANPVYLTVSAGVASTTDRSTKDGAIPGASILVSVNGGAFTNAVVLTFDDVSASDTFEIRVMAIDDDAEEGQRVALVSHSINSGDAYYDDQPILDIFVDVVDNDRPGLDIRQLDDAGDPDTATEVLEGANGFEDYYTVALTRAPTAEVTVTLQPDLDENSQAQVTAVSDSTGQAQLTFNAGNWDTPQLVRVTAVEDGVDGTEFTDITHAVSGSVYSSIPANAYQTLEVKVYDDETPGAIIQQSGGSTVVVDGGATDSYRMRLTAMPTEDVTITLFTDMQTSLSVAGGFDHSNETGEDENGAATGVFEYSFVFDDDNWDEWVEIVVTANSAEPGSSDPIKAFPPQDQNLGQLRGPLIIEGGVSAAGATRALVAPLMLPGEVNDESEQITSSVDEGDDVDTLNIFHTDNSDQDTGDLYYRSVDDQGNPIANVGLALTGFEMSGDKVVVEGTSEAPVDVYYGGGITLNGFETTEILLGWGDETLDIADTGDADEKAGSNGDDPVMITAVHGGGGSDTINISGRGDGPLVVYGDTSENGVRYSHTQDVSVEDENGEFRLVGSIHGSYFNNPGDDTIDATLMPRQDDGFVGIIIYGGAGNDTITGSQDNDHLAGGLGEDTVTGGVDAVIAPNPDLVRDGSDHIYGDSQFNIDLALFNQDQRDRFDTATELDEINAMFEVVTTGAGNGDTINGGSGADVIFGDHGVIGQVDGTRRIESTGAMVSLQTVNIDDGGVDTIHGDRDNDFIFGGVAGDTIYGDLGSDLVFGAHGTVVGDVDASVIGAIDGAGVQNPNAVFTYTSERGPRRQWPDRADRGGHRSALHRAAGAKWRRHAHI
jgi:hypothetical protein